MNQTLTIRQEQFCRLYTTKQDYFGNGTRAYCQAYGLDPDKPKEYRIANANAARLLADASILTRIDELLSDAGLNDAFVDKQLLFLITQNADMPAKIAAIREYNKIRNRIRANAESSQIPQHAVVIYKPERYD